MNRKHLVFSALYGLGLGLVFWSSFIKPKGVDVYVVRDQEDKYHRVIEEDRYKVTIDEGESGVLQVTLRPRYPLIDFFLPGLLAVLAGLSHYRYLRDREAGGNRDEFRDPQVEEIPDKDPLYERFVPRAALEKEFESWRSR